MNVSIDADQKQTPHVDKIRTILDMYKLSKR